MAIIKTKAQRKRCEGLYATKDGKDYQIEIELEGETDAPKRCTVIVNGEKADVEVGKKADKDEIEKSIKKGIEKLGYKVSESKKCEDDAGWDGWEDTEGLEDVLANIEDLSYELHSCVRGAYTECQTWQELSERVLGLADDLRQAGENLKYMKDESKKASEERMSYAELKADALKRVGEGPFADEDDLDDSIMSTLDAMPYDIPEGVKQALASDIFDILYDNIGAEDESCKCHPAKEALQKKIKEAKAHKAKRK